MIHISVSAILYCLEQRELQVYIFKKRNFLTSPQPHSNASNLVAELAKICSATKRRRDSKYLKSAF